jgi:hypothetical protein
MSKENLISEIENKLQFIVTLAIFFGGFVVAAFDFWGIKDFQTLRKSWQWYGIVAALLICYVLFQFIKNNLDIFTLKTMRHLLILGIASFIGPIGFILSVGSTMGHWLTLVNKISIFISIRGLPMITGFITGIIIAEILSIAFKYLYGFYKNRRHPGSISRRD